VKADVVVVGAGIVGSGIALELARAGRDVVIVDRGAGPGTGSTSASSACVRFHYPTYGGVATAWEAKFGWERWADHLGHVDPAGMARYITTGVLVPEFPGYAVEKVAALYREIGIPHEILDAGELASRFPAMDTGRFYPPRAISDDAFWDDPDGQLVALWTAEGGFVDDPQLAAHNLHAAAESFGARSRFRVAVRAVRREDDRVLGVTLEDGQQIDAPIVVNAAGPHSAVINELAGVLGDFRITTRPLRQEVHHVPGPAGYNLEAGNSPMIDDGDLGLYCRPQPGGGVLVGGAEAECDPLIWLDDPDDCDPHPTTAVYETQATRLARRLPELTVPPRPRGVAGVYDVSDDWNPIFDKTSLRGFFVAIGTSGHGFKNAPVIGQMMATLIEQVERGIDHDTSPVVWTTPYTGLKVDLGSYSRRREMSEHSSFSAFG
jgi:sarcosine oxidase, subunit beta